MKLGIDACNIRGGGGATHLTELLRAAEPHAYGFDEVIVWAGQAMLDCIDDKPWLVKSSSRALNGGVFVRAFWQRVELRKLARLAGCDVLFVPGGSDVSGFAPSVALSQNLLPFEWRELRRYGMTPNALRLLLLRWRQGRSFRRATGTIFLTDYARATVANSIGEMMGDVRVIPHGIHARFLQPPRAQRTSFTEAEPCRLLYVSVVEIYKHQWHVAEAVARLRANGVFVTLDLVGPPGPGSLKLERTLNRVDPHGKFIRYLGAIPYEQLHEQYATADISIFASSCENMPNILLEGMASGLPVACSRLGPMPEVLADAGIYFDPEDPAEIAVRISELVASAGLRTRISQKAFAKAQTFSWRRCSHETFGFLATIARHSTMETLG
jgi:glycosyltransferase involved in cell wall biosynthesis